MKKNLIIALVALLFVFAGGFVAFTVLFSDEPKNLVEAPVEAFDAAPSVAVADAAVAEANEIRAAAIKGRVERRDQADQWVVVAQGDVLAMSDEIRTGPDSHATFSIGDNTSVEVSHNTALGFIEISDAVSRIRLSDGRVAASSEGRKVRIEVKNSDAVAETSDGAFAVLTEGEGNVTVASSRGDVALSAQGETVNVEAGTQSQVQPNSAPSKPTEIPGSLFLKVRRPHADARLESAMVAGTATPGSIINIGGDKIPVGSDGHFQTRVELGVGSRDIRVTVVDATGRKETQAVRVITPNANTKGQVEW